MIILKVIVLCTSKINAILIQATLMKKSAFIEEKNHIRVTAYVGAVQIQLSCIPIKFILESFDLENFNYNYTEITICTSCTL